MVVASIPSGASTVKVLLRTGPWSARVTVVASAWTKAGWPGDGAVLQISPTVSRPVRGVGVEVTDGWQHRGLPC